MSTAQRTYVDSASTTRSQHVDNRLAGGSAGDVTKTQETGGRLDWGSSSTGTVFDKENSDGAFGSEIDCDGFETVVLKTETEKSGPTVRLRPWWKDASGTWSPGDKVTLVSTGSKGGAGSNPASLVTNYYHFEVSTFQTRGAAAVKFELVTISNGKVSCWADAR